MADLINLCFCATKQQLFDVFNIVDVLLKALADGWDHAVVSLAFFLQFVLWYVTTVCVTDDQVLHDA